MGEIDRWQTSSTWIKEEGLRLIESIRFLKKIVEDAVFLGSELSIKNNRFQVSSFPGAYLKIQTRRMFLSFYTKRLLSMRNKRKQRIFVDLNPKKLRKTGKIPDKAERKNST